MNRGSCDCDYHSIPDLFPSMIVMSHHHLLAFQTLAACHHLVFQTLAACHHHHSVYLLLATCHHHHHRRSLLWLT
jgi:hypothetical protein